MKNFYIDAFLITANSAYDYKTVSVKIRAYGRSIAWATMAQMETDDTSEKEVIEELKEELFNELFGEY